jgi:predicted metal-dependent phosphoesterase TrpH
MHNFSNELIVNLHMHTSFSDGSGTHRDIANAALRCGLDAVVVTDHNIYVSGPEGYYKEGKKRVLLLVGEEVHNQARDPQKSHLLVMGAGREMAPFAENPQLLIDAVRQAGGYSFLAHPFEYAAPSIGETAIDWVDWQVQGYNGLELWNGFGEIKSIIPTRLHAVFYAFFPELIARAPYAEVLKKWDELLANGQRIYAVGGSDAHALRLSLGPLRRVVFPYDFHFSAINTHVFTPEPLSGDMRLDRTLVLDALAKGHSFVGYDLPAQTRGFRFAAQGRDKTVMLGDEIDSEGGVTLQIKLPERAECRLLRNGQNLKTWTRHEVCTYITTEPGNYRVEVYRNYLGRKRGWIFSNPIFIR